jgi:hypothetical protein
MTLNSCSSACDIECPLNHQRNVISSQATCQSDLWWRLSLSPSSQTELPWDPWLSLAHSGFPSPGRQHLGLPGCQVPRVNLVVVIDVIVCLCPVSSDVLTLSCHVLCMVTLAGLLQAISHKHLCKILPGSAFFVFWDRFSLHTPDSPTSASQVLGLQMCTTTPGLCYF